MRIALFFLLLTMTTTNAFSAVRPHPRLFLPPGRLDQIRSQVRDDVISKRSYALLVKYAETLLTTPVLKREMTGRRLLSISREAVQRISSLSLVALIGGEDKYARRAIDEMKSVCAFSDWNPSHFLDVGEMSLAVGVGYDWLFDKLSADERAFIRKAILEKGLKPSLSPDNWWISGNNNWSQVCHAGVCTGALAIEEDEPELAKQLVDRAIKNIPRAATAYAPDGACDEGPMYWDYGASFQVILSSVLETIRGDDGGVGSTPGFLASAVYYQQMRGPTGEWFNYADCARSRSPSLQPQLFWFESKIPNFSATHGLDVDQYFKQFEDKKEQSKDRLFAFTLIWNQRKNQTIAEAPLALNWLGRGHNPVAVHRTGFDKDALFVGIKGGSPSTSHAHMDQGQFIIENDNVRWAIDLGMQDYEAIEKLGMGLWDRKPTGDRWKIFRLGASGHNILTFNGKDPQVDGKAEIIRFSSGDSPHTVVDLTPVYSDQVKRALRGVKILPNKTLLLQDEWTTADKSADVQWQMLTRADVKIDGNKIVLTEKEKNLTLTAICDLPLAIECIEASTLMKPYDSPNPDTRVIRIKLKSSANTSTTLRVQFATSDPPVISPSPLDSWDGVVSRP